MKRAMWVMAAATVLGMGAAAQAGSFNDNFNSIDGAWVTDRYNPNDFSAIVDPTNSGNNVLNIGISTADSSANRPSGFSGTFYNTQGKQRPVNIGSSWTLSADLLVTTAMLNTTAGSGLIRTDLWGRDSNPIEDNAQYPIIGITNASPTDGFNVNAADRLARYRVWDGDTASGWVDIGSIVPTAGWHNLAFSFDGSKIAFAIDGTNVYNDTTVSAGSLGDLQTAFLEAYNFGDSSYSVQWDNLNAQVVPLPSAAWAGLTLLGGLAGFGGIKRLRAHAAH